MFKWFYIIEQQNCVFIWQNYKYLYRQPNKTPFFCEGCIIITGEHYPDMPFYCLGVNKDRDPGTITVAGSLCKLQTTKKVLFAWKVVLLIG